MDAYELAQLCHTLSIEEFEAPMTKVSNDLLLEGEQRLRLSMVGKLCSTKQANRETFRVVIPKIWKTSLGVEVEVVKENTFVFTFKHMMD